MSLAWFVTKQVTRVETATTTSNVTIVEAVTSLEFAHFTKATSCGKRKGKANTIGKGMNRSMQLIETDSQAVEMSSGRRQICSGRDFWGTRFRTLGDHVRRCTACDVDAVRELCTMRCVGSCFFPFFRISAPLVTRTMRFKASGLPRS